MNEQRVLGWERELLRTVARIEKEPFAWGTSDCLTRVADVALALTGTDPMKDSRGTYDTEIMAYEILAERDLKTIAGALASQFTEIAPAKARRGDCGIVERQGNQAAVIILGTQVLGAHERGSFRVSAAQLKRAFRIG